MRGWARSTKTVQEAAIGSTGKQVEVAEARLGSLKNQLAPLKHDNIRRHSLFLEVR